MAAAAPAAASCSPACAARQRPATSTLPSRAPAAPYVRCSPVAGPQHSWRQHSSARRVAARAGDGQDGEWFEGMYGRWRVEEADVAEVTAYRVGLNAAALAFVLGAAGALLPAETGASAALDEYGNALCVLGAGSLGLSLQLIHIYVTPLKRFVQALWVVGSAGGLYLMASQDAPLPAYVAGHPGAMWLVGPFFAAVTGLAFKEGMCYGKPESAALFFVLPALCLAHLSGVAPPATEGALLAAAAGLAAVFAGRKWTQPVKDDIGDKSVFTFQALPPREQEAVVARLRAAELAREWSDAEDDDGTALLAAPRRGSGGGGGE